MTRSEKVKKLRQDLGMYQSEVSKLTGVPIKTIGYYESGAVTCSDLYEAKLLKIYKRERKNELNAHRN